MYTEKDLNKLGIVLGAQNDVIKNIIDINREQLDMLKEQQKRQVRIIWSSLFIMGLVVLVTGVTIFCAYSSFNRLADQVNQNTQLSVHNAEVIHNAQREKASEGLP